MKLFIIVCCHMDKKIIHHSIERFLETVQDRSLITEFVMVDNHWPLNKQETSVYVKELGLILNDLFPTRVIKPERNLGGQGGINYALEYLKTKYTIASNDLILIYDPDSHPNAINWLESMIDVLKADSLVAYASLTHIAIIDNDRDRSIEVIGSHRVSIYSRPEMFNVTMFKAWFLFDEGMLANSTYYGHVETPMYYKCKKMGAKNVYLTDCIELNNPIPHPIEYTNWKRLHAYGQYKGNFDEYVKELCKNDLNCDKKI